MLPEGGGGPHSNSNTESSKRPPPYSRTQFPFKVLANLNKFREQSRFCDVEIVAGESKFNAHRAVLSAASAYFEAMFRPELGLNEGKQKTVILHSIDGDILHILLDFIYTGRCEIVQSNVQKLLAAADMLQFPEVVDGCCKFLCRELHCTNALGILSFAEAHNCVALTQRALNFVHSNFPAISVEKEFIDTPLSLLSRLLTSEMLRVDSESQVFQAALRWIKHDVTQRLGCVSDILSHVCLALVPVKVIDQALKGCDDKLMEEARRAISLDIASKRGKLSPRLLPKKNIYIIGGPRQDTLGDDADCISKTVAKFDIFRREWSETAPMEIERGQHGVAVLNGKIYVIGGERDDEILANGEVYDPQNDNWNPIAPMTVPRCEFGLCIHGQKLLAMGGLTDGPSSESVECYDPETDTWTMMEDMPEPIFGMEVVSFEGLIYIVGGFTIKTGELPYLTSYNPKTRAWTRLAGMQVERCRMGVAILDRYLYVVGGNSIHQDDRLSSVERYSFDEDKWVTVSPMSVSRVVPVVAAAYGLLYVAGGRPAIESDETITAVEYYDPVSDTWTNCPDLPTGQCGAGAIAV